MVFPISQGEVSQAQNNYQQIIETILKELLKPKGNDKPETQGLKIFKDKQLVYGHNGKNFINHITNIEGEIQYPRFAENLRKLRDSPIGSTVAEAANIRVEFKDKVIIESDKNGKVITNSLPTQIHKNIGTNPLQNMTDTKVMSDNTQPINYDPSSSKLESELQQTDENMKHQNIENDLQKPDLTKPIEGRQLDLSTIRKNTQCRTLKTDNGGICLSSDVLASKGIEKKLNSLFDGIDLKNPDIIYSDALTNKSFGDDALTIESFHSDNSLSVVQVPHSLLKDPEFQARFTTFTESISSKEGQDLILGAISNFNESLSQHNLQDENSNSIASQSNAEKINECQQVKRKSDPNLNDKNLTDDGSIENSKTDFNVVKKKEENRFIINKLYSFQSPRFKKF